MFSFLRFAAPLVIGLMLSSCSVNNKPVDITTTIQQVQQATRIACGFLPTVTTVANIIAAGNPLVSTAGAIAEAICAAVKPPQGARKRGAAPAMVNGVVIHGKFVR